MAAGSAGRGGGGPICAPAPNRSIRSRLHRTRKARRAADDTGPTEISCAPVAIRRAAAKPLTMPTRYFGPALRNAVRIPRTPRPASTTTAIAPARQMP